MWSAGSVAGQKKRLLTIIDETVMNFDTVSVNVKRRGLEIELAPSELVGLVQVRLVRIARLSYHIPALSSANWLTSYAILRFNFSFLHVIWI